MDSFLRYAGRAGPLEAYNITLSDSVVEDGGYVWPSGCGVLMQAANGSTITHNTIRQFSYTGVSVGWTWGAVPTNNGGNVISHNEIHTIGREELSDLGCVYHLGLDPGTVIEGNVCHNVTAYFYGGWGYYLDEGSSYVTVRGNLAYNLKSGGLTQHYGTGVLFENNLLYGVDSGVGRHLNWSDAAIDSGAADTPGSREDISSFTFRRNVVVIKAGVMFRGSTENGYRNMTFKSNVYWATTPTSAPAPVTFPCNPDDPYAGHNYLWVNAPGATDGCLRASEGTCLYFIAPPFLT